MVYVYQWWNNEWQVCMKRNQYVNVTSMTSIESMDYNSINNQGIGSVAQFPNDDAAARQMK